MNYVRFIWLKNKRRPPSPLCMVILWPAEATSANRGFCLYERLQPRPVPDFATPVATKVAPTGGAELVLAGRATNGRIRAMLFRLAGLLRTGRRGVATTFPVFRFTHRNAIHDVINLVAVDGFVLH